MPNPIADLQHKKAVALSRATALQVTAKAATRDFTTAENADFFAALAESRDADIKLAELGLGAPESSTPSRSQSRTGAMAMIHAQLAGIREHLMGKIRADITVAGDGSAILPMLPAQAIYAIAPGLDTLADAGATVEGDLPNGLTRKWAFLVPASTVSTYSESSGPSSSNEPLLYTASVTPAYFSDLVKISLQAWADLPELSQTQTLISMTQNLIYSANAAGITALVEALQGSSGGYSIDEYTDLFQGVINIMGRIHSTFRNPDNVFLCGRKAYEKLLNVRDGVQRPILNAVAAGEAPTSLFGHRIVLDETLSTKIVFGNFQRGAYIARTGTWMQRLMEAFQSSNEIGIKSHQRYGTGFYPGNVPQGSPQPLALLDTQTASS